MRKILAVLLICALLSVALTGCWSYRGLNEMALVMGMAIDKDLDMGLYRVCCEIADLTKAGGDGAIGAKIVEAEGRTIFEAVRNAKRKLLNKLYFGNMGLLMIGEKLARAEGIQHIIEWFLGDAEIRETVDVCIAMGGEAHDVFAIEGLDQSIVSIEISSIIAEDNSVTSSTVSTQVYQAYAELECPGDSLVLPAFHVVKNDDQDVVEANGIAIFQDDNLVGFLPPDQSRYFLLAMNRMHGGIIALPSDGSGAPDVSLELQDSKAKTTFEVVDEKLVFHIRTETTVYLSEVPQGVNVMKEDEIKALETRAGYMLENGIAGFISEVQSTYGLDIFCLGSIVYKYDLSLWRKIEGSWNDMFPTVTVEVDSEVKIVNTAFTITKGAVEK